LTEPAVSQAMQCSTKNDRWWLPGSSRAREAPVEHVAAHQLRRPAPCSPRPWSGRPKSAAENCA